MDMTPRERVLSAIEHKEPDRVPIEFGELNSGICETVYPLRPTRPCYGYSGLAKYLGLRIPQPKLFKEIAADLHVDNIDERILKRFNVDFRNVIEGVPKPKIFPDGSFIDHWGIKWTPSGSYFWYSSPLKDKFSVDDIESYHWPDPEAPVFTEGKEKESKALHENTDYFVHGWGATPFFFIYVYLTGFERWLTDPYTHPEFYSALVDKIFEIETRINERFFGVVGESVDSAWYEDDFGSQTGPFMSVKEFSQRCTPWIARTIQGIKKQAPHVKMFIHSCGSNYDLLGEYIKAGIDVWQTVQPSAWKQDLETLKKEYGSKIAFMGGLDAQQLLPFGSPEEVRAEVRRVISIMAPDGGYIFGPTHNVQTNTPPENVVAMYDAANQYGKYPLQV
jgi:uroporphyrinogen decarboxylase